MPAAYYLGEVSGQEHWVLLRPRKGVEFMRTLLRTIKLSAGMFLLLSALLGIAVAENAVMGELQFEGRTKVEKTSGVWIDGGYVGYLKELKGSKKVMLLPGTHVIAVRQDG